MVIIRRSPVVQLSLLLDQITNLKSPQENLLLILFVVQMENYQFAFFLSLREFLKVAMSGDIVNYPSSKAAGHLFLKSCQKKRHLSLMVLLQGQYKLGTQNYLGNDKNLLW